MIDSNILYCPRTELSLQQILQAGWQSGYAAACKAVNAGSIPASASIGINFLDPWNGSFFRLYLAIYFIDTITLLGIISEQYLHK